MIAETAVPASGGEPDHVRACSGAEGGPPQQGASSAGRTGYGGVARGMTTWAPGQRSSSSWAAVRRGGGPAARLQGHTPGLEGQRLGVCRLTCTRAVVGFLSPLWWAAVADRPKRERGQAHDMQAALDGRRGLPCRMSEPRWGELQAPPHLFHHSLARPEGPRVEDPPGPCHTHAVRQWLEECGARRTQPCCSRARRRSRRASCTKVAAPRTLYRKSEDGA